MNLLLCFPEKKARIPNQVNESDWIYIWEMPEHWNWPRNNANANTKILSVSSWKTGRALNYQQERLKTDFKQQRNQEWSDKESGCAFKRLK